MKPTKTNFPLGLPVEVASDPSFSLLQVVEAEDGRIFRRLVETVLDYAIFLLTPDGRVASWNAGAERIKGYQAHEIVGRHFSVFYPPEALARNWPAEELRRAVLDGRLEDEGWRVRKDGSQFWANVVITPVLGPNGALLGFSKVTRDLTERRRAEERVRDSERALRLLVNSAQDYAIFMLDPQGRITSWNLGAERINGYTASEAIGRHFSMFYEPEALAAGWPQEELRRAAAIGSFEDEGWRLRKDGKRIWANVVITALRGQAGELLGFSKVTRDLTERKAHEEALREREESLRLLVDGVRDHAMFFLDADGRIQTWNLGAQRVFGYAAEQVMGQDVSMFYSAQDRFEGKSAAELSAALLAGTTTIVGTRCRADGSPFWAEITTTSIHDGNNNCKGFIRIVRDTTATKRAEALEFESKRISEFIAVLSHELRNPLAAIKNAVELLRRPVGKPDAARYVDMVGRQVAHMARLIDDLLDVNRVMRGKVRLELEVHELDELVSTAVESVKAVVAAHNHTLHVRSAGDRRRVRADATRMTQVIVNLLTNAVKYTPEGGHIEVIVTDDGEVAHLEVKDNGLGMTDVLLQRAFEPFVQGASAANAEGGLGIGLALVKSIVEQHGGHVAALSAGLGQGTAFTVSLPLAKEPEVDKGSHPVVHGRPAP
ncbi:PAS domain S-box protein [Variovorax sp. OV329]|uniref:sensor histidine kinase n=1 Tax=Variovorax sp. OV329 TaxID=1882825 RepID=UPI0008E7DBAB|nr:PAS domain S-box protein [Variovorax sp. OV329]SFN57108.1 PAS domain S-box-containing protein [Variovorax sp. OV329]